MAKKALVLLAEGFEEVEAVTPADYLRRAGISVTVAAVGGATAVRGARGVTLIADAALGDLAGSEDSWDAVVIPGGLPGAANVAACERANALVLSMAASGRLVCAICAAPAVVLGPLGVLSGRRFVCYPGMEGGVADGVAVAAPVVSDGNFVTGRSAASAGLFSLEIVERLLGADAARGVADAVLLRVDRGEASNP